jgi:translocator assembly and maintenance protein 41
LRNNIYTHFGSELAKNQIVNVIGYGSGVFPQTGNPNATSSNTVDMIITVKDSDTFHDKNIRKNPNDYEGLASMVGSDYLSKLNKFVFPVHFNHIRLESDQIKYGVVSQNLFLKDLIDWNILTLAGRMHKPIKPLIQLDQ